MNLRSLLSALSIPALIFNVAPAAQHAGAAELPANSRAEIEYLLAQLGKSDCEFNRNGSWYSAVEAREHLTMKFDYLARKNLLGSSEDFIELGASKSSMSGQAYQVKCVNAKPVDSAQWLNGALRQYRSQPNKR
jgi:hypothetical protein